MESKPEEPKVTKTDLIASFEEARNLVGKAISDLADDKFEIPVAEGWTVKDILAHFIEWDISSIQNTRAFLSHGKVDMQPDNDNDAFNKKAVEKWRTRSVVDTKEMYLKRTKEVKELLDSLPADVLFGDRNYRSLKGDVANPAWFLVEADHDAGHARQILEWRDRMGL